MGLYNTWLYTRKGMEIFIIAFWNLFFLIGQTVSAFSTHRFGIKEGCVAVAVSCVLRPSYNLYCVRHSMGTTAVVQLLLYKKSGSVTSNSLEQVNDLAVEE